MTTPERIVFSVEGVKVVGDLHLPEGNGPFPSVVVAGPMTSVKEQVTGTYARALAAHGFAALAIDHRHYGESGGEPRQWEYYPHKLADLVEAVAWLKADARVNANRIGAVGICLGAGYALQALAGHPDVNAIAAVAGYYRDVPAMQAADPEGFAARVAQGKAAREHYEKTGEVELIPAVALEGDAAMLLQSTYDYYAGRAKHPNYRNEFAVMSREAFLQFDVQSAAPKVKQPFLMLHGPNALNPLWAEKFFDNVQAPKDRAFLTSKGQTDIYDDPKIVGPASAHIAQFLEENL
ncbi:alpha/beta hydrolase [Pseudovibrio sp. SPO723]|uniref:alpha/beta hydrolase n=1 Tax=Nesiotobacter zosterae TaxID=392721 RepID=UPI0029C4143C|nr:alpha/beta fold hydrolase [Pseudovibrio sp. SPO723]MDX5593508.1 alpha/beta fold hydrolase [Pseudovibrio sp. SPO723]